MASTLIVYSTTDGQTLRICERMRARIEQQGHSATLVPVAQAVDADLERHDMIVVGASIRYGRHHPMAVDFMQRNSAVLNRKASAFFSVNVVARKPDKNRPDTNPYVRQLLGRIAWHPAHVAVFAGRIAYPEYGWLDRTIIRGIMWLTGGPTDTRAVVEFTDWSQVDAFAGRIAAL